MKGAATGTLFVVATPIGNLEDITLRALRLLREAAIIAAEDTRRTANLLRHYEIRTPLVSVHEHNERTRARELIERLGRGESVALVTDAGTPGISDPGQTLVQQARAAGFRVEPVPGASAVTAALSVAGLDTSRFVFAGFPPIRSKDRKRWLAWVATQRELPIVFYEAPHRIRQTLADFMNLGNCHISLGRELTKLHEEWTAGTPEELTRELVQPRGEFVGIIHPLQPAEPKSPTASDAQVARVFGEITKTNPASRRAAIRATAQRLGLSSKAVFAALERSRADSGE